MSSEMNSGVSRRGVVGAGAALIGWGALSANEAAVAGPAPGLPAVGKDELVVTLVGTGSVVPNTKRYGYCTLVQAGGLNLLIDAGRGCAVRLTQAGMAMGKIDAFFLTHFHSDHVIGLPDLWMTGYIHPYFGQREGIMEVNGPIGTSNLCNSMRAAFSDDIRIREADEKIPDVNTQIKGNEFGKDGVIFEKNGVKVTGFEVNHGPLIKPAVGYRVDYNGMSVLCSGDTKFEQNIIKHGQGIDLIVHEVATADAKLTADDQAVMNHHTSPEEAGVIFSNTKPRLAVFSHLVDLMADQSDATMVRETLRRVKTNWSGKTIIGDDLMRISVTKAAIKVQKFNEAKLNWA
jgi:ribonuclease Z